MLRPSSMVTWIDGISYLGFCGEVTVVLCVYFYKCVFAISCRIDMLGGQNMFLLMFLFIGITFTSSRLSTNFS